MAVLSVKEQVWREILSEPSAAALQQKDIAARMGISISTVHSALTVPRRAGAVRVGGRGFDVVDRMKLTVIWAVFRNLWRDVEIDVWSDLPPGKTEGLVSRFEGVQFTAASAFKYGIGSVPSDYDHVLAYAPRGLLPEIEERCRPHLIRKVRRGLGRHHKEVTRLTLLEPDERLPGGGVPLSQIYVDLWQLPVWWATEFTRRIEEMMGRA